MIPAVGFPRAVDLARRDLQAIWDRLPTMHDEGWHPRRPDRDRPTPTLPPGFGPDDVPGPTWDCGLGDHRVRQGWQRMICHIERAEQAATDVLCAALGIQSRSVPPCRPTGLVDAQMAVQRLRDRTADSEALWRQWAGVDEATPTWRVDVPRSQWLAQQLMGPRGNPAGSCFDLVKHAMHETQRVVAIVGNGKPPPPCSDCKRIGSVGQPRKGGKCDACYQRKYRLDRRQRQAKVRAGRVEL